MADQPSQPPSGPEPDHDPDEPGWVSALVSVAGGLGFNRVRLRWKLRAWHRRRREVGNRVERKVAAVRYQHRVCGHCTAVNDRDDKRCHRCGRDLDARPVEVARRLGLPVPSRSMTSLLAIAILVVFVASVLAQPGGSAMMIDADVLVRHGANLPGTGEPERALTSVLVHDGVFHALLGLFAIAVVGSMVERELGGALLAPVFLASGAVGALASDLLGRDGLGMGAAGGLVGLIAAGAVIGHRAGHRRGVTYRNEMLSMAVLVAGFGLFVTTDYRALIPAFLVGGALGRFVPRAALDARPWAARAIALVSVIVVVAITVVAATPLVADPSPLP